MGTLMTKLQAHPICQQANVMKTKVFSSDQFHEISNFISGKDKDSYLY
jgi:hypothetical protein